MGRERTLESEGWVALPGLFDAAELSSVPDVEVRAIPLVRVGPRILFGVYVRERDSDGERVETTGVRTRAGIAAARRAG